MKLMKLAVILGLAGSGLAMVSSPAQAFQMFFDNKTTSVQSGTTYYNYEFHIELKNGDVITPGMTPVSFTFAGTPTNRPSITGKNAPRSYVDGEGDTQAYFNGQNASLSMYAAVDSVTTNRTRRQEFVPSTTFSYVNPSTPGYSPSDNIFRFIVNLASNASVTTLCVGSACAYTPNGFTPSPNAVPEAESALVPVLALGFGYLYRSKKRKKLQLVATQDQERSLV